jgi:two-component sensor histidine kinase
MLVGSIHLKRIGITWLFCLAIAAAQYGFSPHRGWLVPLVYSLLIGTFTVVFSVALGRLAIAYGMPHSAQSWPSGWRGGAIIAISCLLGVLLGTALADRYFGWSSWSDPRIMQMSLLISVLSCVIISYYFYAKGHQEALSLQVAQAQLRLLESQLDPHMLFNTLANLRALIGQDPARAQLMLDQLNRYLRATLAGSRAPMHSMADEFERLKNYLALMQVRMGSRLSFSLEFEPVLENSMIPSLMLQPIVENAIKHALEPSADGGHLSVSARAVGKFIMVEISDNGPGFNRQAPDGFGLAHVRERLSSHFGPKAQFTISSNVGQGTTCNLTWPRQ